VRLFAAVPLPHEVRAHAAAALAPLASTAPPELHLVDDERWHLTLAFFGEVDERRVASLGTRLARVAARRPAMLLRVERAGRFGERVLWLGIGGDIAPLRDVARAVASAGRRSGLDLDERPYRPHLTVARARPPADLRVLVSGLDGYRGPEWTPGHVELVHSRLGPRPSYATLRTLPLKAPRGSRT